MFLTLRLRRSNRLHLHRRLKPALPIVLGLSAAVLVIVIESHALTGVSLHRPGRTDYENDYAHEHDELSQTWGSPETVELWEPPRLSRRISRCIRMCLDFLISGIGAKGERAHVSLCTRAACEAEQFVAQELIASCGRMSSDRQDRTLSAPVFARLFPQPLAYMVPATWPQLPAARCRCPRPFRLPYSIKGWCCRSTSSG